MAKTIKTFKIKSINNRNGSEMIQEGTLEELIETYRYTLESGKSWEHEKGNKKINLNPKSTKALVTQLNNAINNSASNGYGSRTFELVSE